MTAKDLAYQVTKYANRNGYTHRDLLRLSHAKASGDVGEVLRYIVKGELPAMRETEAVPSSHYDMLGEVPYIPEHVAYLHAVEQAKASDSVDEILFLIETFDLPREVIPTQFLKEKAVWSALLQKMPMTAMIRNLATMSRVGLLQPMSEAAKTVTEALYNAEKIKKARIHPIQVLSALRVYSAGGKAPTMYGYRAISRSSGGEFEPLAPIQKALTEAFYTSFGNVEPSGKRTLLAFDISGSMDSGEIAGVPGLTPREAAAVMGMVTARAEWTEGKQKFPLYHSIAFTTTVSAFSITPTDSLENVVNKMRRMQMGGTDVAQAVLYADKQGLEIDTFIIYTDNEHWAGHITPVEALRQYRRKTGIQARCVAVGMTATDFSVLDSKDPLSMNVVGFDSAAPQIISQFSRGEI